MNTSCPKCGSENLMNSVHFAFCTECDWEVGQKLHPTDKQVVAKMVEFMKKKSMEAQKEDK